MDTIQNIKAFLLVARTGSITIAARQLGVVPSVITKRIDRLEDQMRVKLLQRSTRRIGLTEAGEARLPRLQAAVTELETIFRNPRSRRRKWKDIADQIPRQRSPILSLGEMLTRFQVAHPRIEHRAGRRRSFGQSDRRGFRSCHRRAANFLSRRDRRARSAPILASICASPAYLERRGAPHHPRDLVQHDCLTFATTGQSWAFESRRGLINVDVKENSAPTTAICCAVPPSPAWASPGSRAMSSRRASRGRTRDDTARLSCAGILGESADPEKPDRATGGTPSADCAETGTANPSDRPTQSSEDGRRPHEPRTGRFWYGPFQDRGPASARLRKSRVFLRDFPSDNCPFPRASFIAEEQRRRMDGSQLELVEPLQPEGCPLHQARQSRVVEMDAVTRQDLHLPVQRREPSELRDHRVGHQSGRRHAVLDQPRQRLRLYHCAFTAPAGLFPGTMRSTRMDRWNDVEHLADVPANLAQAALAARAGRRRGLDDLLAAWQMLGQRANVALGLLAGASR